MTTLHNLVFSIIFGLSAVASGSTVYVDHDATSGLNDGTSWADAYTDLQDALIPAYEGDEIWVAEGTYYPGTSRSSSFELLDDMCIYGGFDGTEEYLWQRDFRNNETILSGDIGAADSDACYCVVLAEDILNALLDGFTITNGYTSTGMGGCMQSYNCGEDLCISNCIIQNGHATSGGGIYVAPSSDINLTSCIIRNNSANKNGLCYGGGLYIASTGGRIHNCLFYDNSCRTTSTLSYHYGQGGAAYGTGMFAVNCTFANNDADEYGSFYGYRMENCISSGNQSDYSVNGRQIHGFPHYSCIEGTLKDCTNGATRPCDLCRQTINGTPGFVDASNNNYRLSSGSPCINTGRNMDDVVAGERTIWDLDGNNRYVQEITPHSDTHWGIEHTEDDHINDVCPCVIDMGCYEYQSSNTPWLQLKAVSDTGLPSDNITNLDNSYGKTLQFELGNTLDGSEYQLSVGEIPISSIVTAISSTVAITTNGLNRIANGWVTIKCNRLSPGGIISECLIYIDTEAPEFTGFSVNKGNAYRSNIAFLDFDFSEDIYLASTESDPLHIYEYMVMPYWLDVTLSNTPDYTVTDNTLSCDIWSQGYQTVLYDQQYIATLVRNQITDIAGNTLPQPGDTERNYCKFYRFCGDANCDLTIGLDDFSAVTAPNMGWTGAWDSFEPGDYDLNGTINLDDFILMRQKYGFTFTNGPTENALYWLAN